MDLTALTAAGAAAALARGDVTSEELVEACLVRTSEREGEIGAWAFLDPEHARKQARAADAARRSGKGVGPLNGLPVGIKDIIDTADQPTECGSPIFAGRQPERDAACVAALRNAGCVIMGKTVTTELAGLSPSRTRNPHNPAHTPGGSSAGSAAAVASGMVPGALATQTGGSVIRPASFCGIYALKPTMGLISRAGVLMQSHTLDTVGVYGRSIDDLGLLADAMARHDPSDPVSYLCSQASLLAMSREEPPLPPVFCWLQSPAFDVAEPVTMEAFGEVVEALGERCEAVQFALLPDMISAWRTVQAVENASYYGGLLKSSPELLSDLMRTNLEAGARIGAQEYLEAIEMRRRGNGVVEELLLNYNAILMPSALGPAPAGLGSTGDPVFNGPWTLMGCPVVSLPLLDIDGLPLGVQLIGRRRDDGRLLRTARWLVEELAGAD